MRSRRVFRRREHQIVRGVEFEALQPPSLKTAKVPNKKTISASSIASLMSQTLPSARLFYVSIYSYLTEDEKKTATCHHVDKYFALVIVEGGARYTNEKSK